MLSHQSRSKFICQLAVYFFLLCPSNEIRNFVSKKFICHMAKSIVCWISLLSDKKKKSFSKQKQEKLFRGCTIWYKRHWNTEYKNSKGKLTKDTMLTWKNWKQGHKSSEKLWAKRVLEYRIVFERDSKCDYAHQTYNWISIPINTVSSINACVHP